jgi:hypothetical protein
MDTPEDRVGPLIQKDEQLTQKQERTIELLHRVENLLRAKGLSWEAKDYTHGERFIRITSAGFTLEWGYSDFDAESKEPLPAGPYAPLLALALEASPSRGTIAIQYESHDSSWTLMPNVPVKAITSSSEQALYQFVLDEISDEPEDMSLTPYDLSEDEAFEDMARLIDLYLKHTTAALATPG